MQDVSTQQLDYYKAPKLLFTILYKSISQYAYIPKYYRLNLKSKSNLNCTYLHAYIHIPRVIMANICNR